MSVLHFAEDECLEVMRAGGKGASLARMASLGLPVPPGFVVPADALAAALGDRAQQLASLSADDAERAQRIVHATEIGPELREEVTAAYRELGDDAPVAVRSSACAEDSQEASFAGQQETYLDVRGAEEVIERIGHCWGSFFSERALFYRAQKGSLDDLGMAVVVQRMVSADVAGVLFTVDPVRRRKDRMVVEAVFGLGEACVSGQVTPDNYVLARDGALKRRRLSVQPLVIESAPEGGTVERELDPAEGGAATLEEDQLRELARLGEDLQGRLGGPQDIEWAIEGGELYVLQARPVTA
ncbi:MAG TPA: PEP/pyruvate-binding domain-containing protein [Thermoleophilaceae bacterium]|jgi:pyruvate,water dikinase|nr:PEP/pyruvate-binding domain-containing protein [Thermoleophilaceae bacterium]